MWNEMEELGRDNEKDLIELRRILLDYTLGPEEGHGSDTNHVHCSNKSKLSGVNVAREQYMRYSGLRILPKRWTIVSELANTTVQSCSRKSVTCPGSIEPSLPKTPSSSVRTRSQIKATPVASPPVIEPEASTSIASIPKRKVRKQERQQKNTSKLNRKITRRSARTTGRSKQDAVSAVTKNAKNGDNAIVELKPTLGRPYRSIKWKLCTCCSPGLPLRFHDRPKTLSAPPLTKAVKKRNDGRELETTFKTEPDKNEDTFFQRSPGKQSSAGGDNLRADAASPGFDREIRIILEKVRVPRESISTPIVKVEPENFVETEGTQPPVGIAHVSTGGQAVSTRGQEVSTRGQEVSTRGQEVSFQCPRCGVVRATFAALAHHLKKHEKAKRELPIDTHKFTCDKCGMKFFSEIAFNHHYLNWHKKREERKKRQRLLNLSMQYGRTDTAVNPNRFNYPATGRFACVICKEKFLTGLLLDEHFSSAHRSVLEYKCQICCRRFHNEVALEDHKMAIHFQ